jgi:hypothetical protein
MKITNGFFNPISAFAQTNLIIELKLTVYLFSKKIGTDHLTSRGGYGFFLNKYSEQVSLFLAYSFKNHMMSLLRQFFSQTMH